MPDPLPPDASSSKDVDPHALVRLAEALASRGQIERARIMYRTAAGGDDSQRARRAYASFLTRIEDFPAAIDEWLRLRNFALRTNDVQAQAEAESQLAIIHRELGDHDQAVRWQQRAISARTASGALSADDLSHCALDAVHAGDLNRARDLLSRAFATHVERGSLDDLAADIGNLAAIALLRGELADGIDLLWFAYRLHTELRDARGAGIDLLNLAEAHFQQGDLETATQLSTAAEAQFERAAAPRSLDRARRLRDEIGQLLAVQNRDVRVN